MNTSTLIQIFILDDNEDHIPVAMAGLLPIPPSILKDIDIKRRVKLARENFHIEYAHSIQEAFIKLKVFKPDLFIIDIDLKDNSSFHLKENKFKNGIDFYRHIGELFPD